MITRLSAEQLIRYATFELNRRESETWAEVYRDTGRPAMASVATQNAREWERRRDAVGDEANEG